MANGSKTPPTYADIRLILGAQGGGKSTVLVGFPIGDYYDKLTGIRSPSGQVIKAKSVAKSVNPSDYNLLRKCGLYPSKFKYVRIFSGDGKQSKLIKMPKGYAVESSVRIFANFTLSGVRFWRITLDDVIKYMNTELFNDAWILSDESAMTDSRNSMDKAGKLMAQFGATIRKRNAHFCIAVQYSEMVERRFRLFATTTIECSYDEDTEYVNLDVTQRGEKFSTDFYQPLYRPFYKTQELIAVPQHKQDGALGKFGDGSLAKEVAELKRQLKQTQKELTESEEANLTLREALKV